MTRCNQSQLLLENGTHLVTRLSSSGRAEGKLRVGDEIMSMNGATIVGASHREAVDRAGAVLSLAMQVCEV